MRIKVLQALYAYLQKEDGDFALGQKDLLKSIDRIYELYIRYLTLFDDVLKFAVNRIEEGKKKKVPRPEDLNPNLKFVENKVLVLLSESRKVMAEAQKRKINWMGEAELIRKTYTTIKNSPEYIDYMAKPGSTFKEDQEFMVKIFKEYIANSEDILNHFEEMSIQWMDDIDLVCGSVIKTINSLKENSDEYFDLLPLYKDPGEDEQFVKDLFRKTLVNGSETEEMISTKASNWETERIAAMDMLLMKMAITEVKEFPTIPVKVTLNEYIEISKFYSTPKSNIFINGILDKSFAELKSKGEIRKVGRGLIE